MTPIHKPTPTPCNSTLISTTKAVVFEKSPLSRINKCCADNSLNVRPTTTILDEPTSKVKMD
jgi:hypothetical protein